MSQTVENLNEYLQNGTKSHRLLSSNLCHDFLGINWDGSDLKFFENMSEFLKVFIEFLVWPPYKAIVESFLCEPLKETISLYS